MGQPGFFDMQRRYEGLDAKSDPLVAILAAVPFEPLRRKLKTALVGIAPMNRDSGQWRGQAHIAGGRLSVRCALYMATLPAIRFNPPVRSFYQHLRTQGKAPKLAITAAMRKLLITANVIIQQDRPWKPHSA